MQKTEIDDAVREDTAYSGNENINNRELYAKILVSYVNAAVWICVLIFLVPRIIGFMWPFVVGWLIAMMANPLVRMLETKLNILRKHGTAIVIIFSITFVIAVIYLLAYILVKQGVSFVHNFPDIYESISEGISDNLAMLRDKAAFLPESVKDTIDNINSDFGAFVKDFVAGMISQYEFTIGGAGHVVKSVAEALLMTIITILASYFFTAEHDNIFKVLKGNMPKSVQKGYNTVMNCTVRAFGGYFKAQFKIMCIVFIILSVGLLCLGVNYAVLFAFVIAFVDFLPVFGAGAIIWPWCVIDIVLGNYISAVVLFALYLACQAVRQFMQPKMVGDSIGMSPLATLFFMFIGYRIAGIPGLIIGIPVGMVLKAFYMEGVFDNLFRGAKIIIGAFNSWRKF